MQHLKVILITIILSVITFFMFFIGLGITLFILITLAIVGLYMKMTSRGEPPKQYAQQWRQHFTKNEKTHYKHSNYKSHIIEGNYEVIDN